MSGLPTTMEDWQLRLRAQKEQDRKLKTETAEMLRGYRGGVKEDDLKLSALKMEDRKKQQDAERILRDYRAKEFGEGRERPVRKDVDYPPVVAKQDDDPFIVQGNVSALAATFDSPVNVNDAKLSGAEVSQFSVPSLDVDGYNDVDDLVESEYAVDEKKSDSLDSPSDGVLVESWGQNDDEEPLHDHPTVVRLDVNFSFGLLTTSSNPILDNYMLAVEETVQQALLANPNLAIHVSYNARFGPFVEECQWDDSFADPQKRPNVRRALVTASVPVFLSNGVAIGLVRGAIVAALFEAVQSGSFLAKAQGNHGAF